jgi:hypothetical protein
MKDAPGDNVECKECGASAIRDYSGCSIGNTEYAKPLHSDSLAMNPNQVSEHRKKFPDVEVDKQGRPVFRNFKQHDRYLKKTGFVKVPQKTKRKGKK